MSLPVRLLLCLSTALALPFISAPANLHLLHWVAFLPLFLAMQGLSLRRGVLLAYLTGWLSNLIIFWWLIETIQRFSSLPWALALVVHLLGTTVFSLSYGLFGLMPWLRQRLGRAWILAMPLVVVAGEQAFPVLFPYYQGVSQYRVPWMFQLASVTGVMGLSFLVILVNAALTETVLALRARQRPPIPALLATAGLLLANLAFGAWRFQAVERELETAPVLRVSLLQQAVTMDQRLSESPWEGFFSWIGLTRKVFPDQADLVVWPEGSLAFNPTDERPFSSLRAQNRRLLLKRLVELRATEMLPLPEGAAALDLNDPALARAIESLSIQSLLSAFATQGGFDLLVGGGTIEDNPNPGPGERDYIAFNSLYVFDRKGGIEGRFDKMVPLPFGEYIPLADTFPFLKTLVQGPGDFRAGKAPTFFTAHTRDGQALRYSTPICYEAILQPTMRRFVGGGSPEETADFFVNITNDAWFGDTASPHQHAMLTAVQTVQVGRPMLRIAYTGISWVVEPHGRILHETAPFTDHAEVVPMRVKAIPTVYSRGGWLFGWLCVLGAAAMIAWGRARGAPPA